MTQSSAAYSGMRRVRNPPNGWLVLAGLDVAAVACAQTPKLGIGSTVTPTTGERITTDIAEYGMCSRNYHHPRRHHERPCRGRNSRDRIAAENPVRSRRNRRILTGLLSHF